MKCLARIQAICLICLQRKYFLNERKYFILIILERHKMEKFTLRNTFSLYLETYDIKDIT